jgi:hypothetical protein
MAERPKKDMPAGAAAAARDQHRAWDNPQYLKGNIDTPRFRQKTFRGVISQLGA